MEGDFPLLFVSDLIAGNLPIKKLLAGGGMELARKEGELTKEGFKFKKSERFGNHMLYAFQHASTGQLAVISAF